MKKITTLLTATVLASGFALAAQAQSAPPTVPNPAIPCPENPVATNGAPMTAWKEECRKNGSYGPQAAATSEQARGVR